VRDVLKVIDAKPLHYAHDIGVDPEHVSGRTEFNLHFRFPLLRSLKFDDVEYGVRATLTGASITGAAMDRDLSVDHFEHDISGPGKSLDENAEPVVVVMTMVGGPLSERKVRARQK